ncbi:MAG: PIN domain-containing protein [Deltaproteobacteria bacterium]|nr:PIN domain-containing protein [Deltaproteobacteria bacterium]
MKKTIYWDSNTFLGLLNHEDEPENSQMCESVWKSAEQGLSTLLTSTLTIAEVIHIKGREKLNPSHREKVNLFFRAEHIVLRPLTREIAQLARDVVWDNAIKPKDAIHVATAAYFKLPELQTLDKGLLAKGRVEIKGFSVMLKEPSGTYQTSAPLGDQS